MIRIYIICDIFIIFISFFIGKYAVLNSQISFLLAMFISYSSYNSYKKMISKEILSKKYDYLADIKDDIEEKQEKPALFKSRITFFSPLKMVGYFILGVSFYLLCKFGLINSFAFLLGIFPLPIGSIIYGLLYAKS
ncbi:hypothetical protein F1B92_06065 [Campylobacter sp. FMV-PI01]|uniref:Uncharacterized protein n=1 Tax=Campylobacter portucalensis TaxID=2608384 RepID=A0A6L5WHY3_9BACT|nr:hypothetical protein [Campylobacter portucalensis]